MTGFSSPFALVSVEMPCVSVEVKAPAGASGGGVDSWGAEGLQEELATPCSESRESRRRGSGRSRETMRLYAPGHLIQEEEDREGGQHPETNGSALPRRRDVAEPPDSPRRQGGGAACSPPPPPPPPRHCCAVAFAVSWEVEGLQRRGRPV